LQVVLPKLQKSGQDAVKTRLRELRARFRASQAQAKVATDGGAASPGATTSSGELSDDDESDVEESGSEASLASAAPSSNEPATPSSTMAAQPGQTSPHLHRRHVSAAGAAAPDAARAAARSRSTAGVVDAAAADRRQRARVNAFIAHAADQGTMLSYTTTAVCAVRRAARHGRARRSRREAPRYLLSPTAQDYMEMVVQFGYVVLFSVVWPFAPLAALLNNLIEIRSDPVGIAFYRRRAMPQRAEGIGTAARPPTVAMRDGAPS